MFDALRLIPLSNTVIGGFVQAQLKIFTYCLSVFKKKKNIREIKVNSQRTKALNKKAVA